MVLCKQISSSFGSTCFCCIESVFTNSDVMHHSTLMAPLSSSVIPLAVLPFLFFWNSLEATALAYDVPKHGVKFQATAGTGFTIVEIMGRHGKLGISKHCLSVRLKLHQVVLASEVQMEMTELQPTASNPLEDVRSSRLAQHCIDVAHRSSSFGKSFSKMRMQISFFSSRSCLPRNLDQCVFSGIPVMICCTCMEQSYPIDPAKSTPPLSKRANIVEKHLDHCIQRATR